MVIKYYNNNINIKEIEAITNNISGLVWQKYIQIIYIFIELVVAN